MCVVNTDIGCSDHFLLWIELGIFAKSKYKCDPLQEKGPYGGEWCGKERLLDIHIIRLHQTLLLINLQFKGLYSYF